MSLSGRITKNLALLAAVFRLGASTLPAQTSATASSSAPAPATTSEDAPRYEVASIRQNLNPERRWRMNFTDNGVAAMDVTLFYAIEEAYGAYDKQLWINVPDWIQQKRFDIEAKYDADKYPVVTLQQHQAMLQQLFAERFKLATHREQREFPVFALQIAKNGPKFSETKPQDAQMSALYGQMCHITRSRPGSLEMKGCTMEQFAHDLTGWTRHTLGRTIVDRTGQNKRYDFSLKWDPETGQSTNALDANPGPTIFTALQEQLGLILKSEKAPLPVIVIDHVEMPTEN